jgi:hypothetical protein
MADEHDEWLDKETAERLLCGEPVEVAGEHARTQAELLSGALCDLTGVAYANSVELPGEAAALAAFQQERAASGRRRKAAATGAEGTGDGHLLDTVRLGPALRTAPGHPFGHPLRRGLGAAVAVCALCMVAVVAGTGTLKAPFVSKRDPLPAASVPGAGTRAPEALMTRDVTPGPGGPARTPATDGPFPGRPDSAGSAGDSGTGSGADGKGNQAVGQSGVGFPGNNSPRGGVPDTAGNWYAQTIDLCRDYHSGAIDLKRKDDLESAVKGAKGAKHFCDRVLDGVGIVAGDGGSDGDGIKNGHGDGIEDPGDGGVEAPHNIPGGSSGDPSTDDPSDPGQEPSNPESSPPDPSDPGTDPGTDPSDPGDPSGGPDAPSASPSSPVSPAPSASPTTPS